MKNTRRSFLISGAALATTAALPAFSFKSEGKSFLSQTVPDQFDPWIEVLPAAIKHNVRVLYKLGGNKPIMAVVKNNGYGLGDVNVAKIMENMPEVIGFAAVKTDACIRIRESGIKKPVMHMGMASDRDFMALTQKDIQLSIYNEGTRKLLDNISKKIKKPIHVNLYIDTGMSRMGIPYQKALPWIEDLSSSTNIKINSAFTGLTEEPDYDKEQVKRLKDLSAKAANKGVNLRKLHAASSNAIYHYSEATLDMVRPGISLYGGYPTYADKEAKIAKLQVAYRLNTRVVRVEKLRAGDSVSYGRNYIAKKPIWIATLPIGHADGYLRAAVKGTKVLVNNKLYPVIGAVSASHTIIEIGAEQTVNIGDIATLEGPDHPEIHPSHLSAVTGVSVYDVYMHLSSRLPKIII